MITLKAQIFRRIYTGTLLVILLFLAAYYLSAGRLFIFNYEKMAAHAYELLSSAEMQELLRGTDGAQELLDSVAEDVNYVICNDQFELLLGSVNNISYHPVIEHMRDIRDLFIPDPEPGQEKEQFGEPVSVKGKKEEDGQLYYIYVYKNTRNLFTKINFGMNVLFVCFGIMAVELLFCYKVILKRTMKGLDSVETGLHALSEGNYLARILEDPVPADLAKMAADFNRIAQTVHYDKSVIRNMEYLITKKGKKLDDTDVSSTKLARNITHQLKTPLAIISSQVELFNMETDPQKREYYYTSIMEEIDKMSLLITNILSEARNEHNYVSIRLRSTNISELFEDLVSKYESWLSYGGIHFSYSIAPGLFAMADPVQLEQAVHNYMMNAYRHTRKGKDVRLSVTEEEKLIRIVVFNEGNGIPVREMESIWEDSYQGEKSENREEIGLGLYIAKDIVIQHHGTCGVKNVSNGVEFWIRIPLLEEAL